MAISQIAIDNFLRKQPPWVPQFKGADPDWLKSTIYDVTGKPYKPTKTQPRPHQLEGIAFALYQRRALLYYSMRLGKTLISLHWAEQLRKAGLWRGKGIIVCHAPIGIWVWQSEAEQHSELTIYPVRNQLEELIAGLESNADLIVMPWSGLQNIFTEMRANRKGNNRLYPNLDMIRDVAEAFELAIFDEIHMAKNWKSLRYVLGKELVKRCQFRLGLTGTPMGRNAFDLWAPASLIDDGKTLGFHYQFFEVAFGAKKKNYFSGSDEYVFDKRKQTALEAKIGSISLSYKLEECQQTSTFMGLVELRMAGDQRTAYDEAIDKFVHLPDKEHAEIRNTFIRMRQISSGYLPFVDAYGNQLVNRFRDNAKAEWLRAVLDELDDTPLVLFHDYTETGALIVDILTEAKVSHHWLHGDTKDKPGVVQDFQAGKVQALVVQSATGSMAIELSRADLLVFYESPVSPIVRAQAEARPMSAARGTRPLLIDDVVCSGIERKVLSFVRSGKDLSNSIIHDRRELVGGR